MWILNVVLLLAQILLVLAVLDLQYCIRNFEVHRDKIIRTQDSQKMGARYLSELDLGSRQECLRLCCETEDCDVFVYEEKNAGSCYLFQCGPPEDFKCKFTHHVNYSSAVLTIDKQLTYDLEAQIQNHKHETDLTKLRRPHTTNDDLYRLVPLSTAKNMVLPSTAVPPSVPRMNDEFHGLPPPPPPPPPPPQTDKSYGRCSRYQFECKTSGECIAIYNACDGIFQCSDGSDEAAELNCPNITIQIPTRPPQDPKQQQEFLMPRDHQLPNSVYNNNIEDHLKQPPSKSNFQQLPSLPSSNSQFNNNNNLNAPIWNGKDQLVQHKDFPTNGITNTNQHVADDEQQENRLGLYDNSKQVQEQNYNNDISKHVDSRKENYVRTDQEQKINQERSRKQEDNEPNYQQKNSPEPTSESKFVTSGLSDFATKTPEHHQNKLTEELKNTLTRIVNTYQYSSANRKLPNMDYEKDGTTQVPNGAYISLALGVLLTGLTAVFLFCRLRLKTQIRRRSGGKPFSSDADYLVNGMYL